MQRIEIPYQPIIFSSTSGQVFPAISAEQMKLVYKLATTRYGLEKLQILEATGQELAHFVRLELKKSEKTICILVGGGRKGAGGLSAARYLYNQGFSLSIILARDTELSSYEVRKQLEPLEKLAIVFPGCNQASRYIQDADLTIDALFGCGLIGIPDPQSSQLMVSANRYARRLISLDIPSGLDASTGQVASVVIRPSSIMTLALPKLGLSHYATGISKLYVADIGIPARVIEALELPFKLPVYDGGLTELGCTGLAGKRCHDEF